MRKLSLLLFAAGSLWSPAGPAQATHVATGSTCGLWSVTNPAVEGDTQTGFLYGGPVTATTAGSVVSVTCTVQVGAASSTHAGADAATAAVAGLQTVTMPATPVSYRWAPVEPVFLCTEWTVNGTPYYYDGVNAVFSTSSSVDCVAVTVAPGWIHSATPAAADV